MKNILKAATQTLIALSLVALIAAFAQAQTRDVRFISAKAGGVNFVSGDVSARHDGETEWNKLTAKDDLKDGDTVRTGADGKTEVLLNPGSYFRMGGASEFVMVDTSLDDLQLGLSRGSAVIEAVGYDNLDLSISVATPQAKVKILRAGVYRLNVLPSGETEVAVLKGRAVVGESNPTVVKGGSVARVGKGGFEVAKLDKQNRDALDLWSRDRGKELAKANEKIERRNAMMMLARMRTDSFFDRNGFNSGIWFWNSFSACYTFLPFYGGWHSPYGYGYDSWLFVPGYYNNAAINGSPGSGGYTRSNGSGNPYPSGGNGSNSSSGNNTYPGNFNGTTSPSPSSGSTPTREVPSRSDPDRPMPERTREPGSPPNR